ncbi:MAG: hypothetical protein V4850_07805 [Myxococcota bacterium]
MWRCCPMILLVGCRPPDEAPCPTFAETELVDEVGDPDALEEVRQAFADFASWTSRPGLCLMEVALVDEVPIDAASGLYVGDRVLVEPHAVSVRETTLHELCHAWDWTEGRPSAERPDLFPPDSVPEHPAYPTEDDRTGEAFAGACGLGARAVAEEELAATLCGAASPVGDAEAWVRAHVYDAFVDELGVDVAFAPMAITRASLWGDGTLTDVTHSVAAGDVLAVLTVDARTAVSRLWLVDPVTATVTEVALPAEADGQSFGLLGSDGDPIVWSPNPLRAWRIDPADGSATPLSLSQDPETRFLSGYVHGDTAWLQPYHSGAAGTPHTLDLATAAVGPLFAADGAALETQVWIYGNGESVMINVEGRIETWSFAEAAWRSVAHPSILTSHALPLADGRIAGRYMARTCAETRSIPVVSSVDPPVWTFPDTPCDVNECAGGELVTVGDVLYGLAGRDFGGVELIRVQP